MHESKYIAAIILGIPFIIAPICLKLGVLLQRREITESRDNGIRKQQRLSVTYASSGKALGGTSPRLHAANDTEGPGTPFYV